MFRRIEERNAAVRAKRTPGQVARRPEGHSRACCFSLFPIADIDGRKEFTVEVNEIDDGRWGWGVGSTMSKGDGFEGDDCRGLSP